ncbi:MAG: TraR/DksA family transcriptional regulator [Burkholderiales bacterium]|nr:TraR/DksA family transcriptional regulator [Burkholderiales bacterium]
MDLVDRAQLAEAMHRDTALASHARQRPAAASATHCEEPRCGIRIPEARRRAIPGVQRCVECQARIERAGRPGGL